MSAGAGPAVHTDRTFWRRLEFAPRGRRFGPTIMDRYILAEIFQPFFVSLLFFTSLFVSIALKDVIGDLLGKGVDPVRIFKFLFDLLFEKMSLTLPVACLFSGILAAGRLSGDSEITALRAAGISFARMYRVFLFAGLLSMFVMGYLIFFVSPQSARDREDFENWLKNYHSLTMVSTGRFMGRGGFDGVSSKGQDIYAESRTGNILNSVQIREWNNSVDLANSPTVPVGDNVRIPIGNGFITQVIHAKSGELLSRIREDGTEEKLIRLTEGFTIELDDEQKAYQVTDFGGGTMDYVIPAPPGQLGRLDVKPDNRTFAELFDFLERLENGGIEITPMTILGSMANLDGLRDYGGLVGEASDEELEGMMNQKILLPSIQQMEMMALQMQFAAGQYARTGEMPQIAGMENFGALLAGGEGNPSSQILMLSVMLQNLIKDAKKTGIKYHFEIHRRVATPIGCLLFFFVSFPLGLVVKRSGKGMSFTLALGVFAGYYIVSMVGTSQATQGKLDPAVAAWLPNLILLGFGFYLMASRTDGFSPFAFLTRPLGRLFAFLWRPVAPYARLVAAPFVSVFRRLGGPRVVAFLRGALNLALAGWRGFVRLLLRLRDRIRPPVKVAPPADHR
ncbi:MAG: LptF/LptG family permease [bacterium]|nr:LptF/LptG family permease [bacterium]